ncbi:MAG: lytic murein transglycosylase [Alphaproteobacteria bacterium]
MERHRAALGSLAFLAACLSALAGCAAMDPADPPAAAASAPSGVSAATVPGGPIVIDQKAYSDWLKSFRAKALAAGISRVTFNAALGKVKPNPDIIARDQAQPEVAQAVWEYLDNATSQKRIDNGSTQLAANAVTLDKIEQQYGVDRHTLIAIWGLESNYGTIVGKFNIFEGLATLAYEGRRRDWAENELISALKIVERHDVKPERMVGSWAGAMGQTQFIPSAYLNYAVDEDGDGRHDLFDSVPDVLASIGNFLAKSGWTKDQKWGEEVKLPKDFDFALADPTIKLPMSRWHELGVATLDGKTVPAADASDAAVFLPGGYKGPAFLTFDNFRVFLKYNNSTPYALAAGLLGDRLGGSAGVSAPWPRDERPLTLSERIELQTLLTQLGYASGKADGIIGGGTRAAIRAYQLKINVPADGFATVALLARLRTDAASTASPAPPSP